MRNKRISQFDLKKFRIISQNNVVIRNGIIFIWITWFRFYRNLTEYAIQSRQRFSGYPNQQFNFQNHADDNNHINRFQGIRYGGNIPIYAGHYNNFQKFQYSYPPNGSIPLNQNPHAYYPPFIQNQNGYDPRPQHNYPNPQNGGFLSSILPSRDSFMGALESIARNDELRCVPRILCEVTSGTLSARQSGLKLPFNVNMDSIVGWVIRSTFYLLRLISGRWFL